MMKLYYLPGACSLAAHIAARELDLDVELIAVDPKTQLTEAGTDFLLISPFGYVPLLELDDGATLREGLAVLQYLADLRPQAGLAPAEATIGRYRLLEWLGFLSSEVHKNFIPLLYARLAGDYGTLTVKPKLSARFAWIDTQLAEQTYLMGDTLSVADVYLFVLTQWGQAEWLNSVYHADIHLDELGNLKRWYARMRERPAVRAALDAEGLT